MADKISILLPTRNRSRMLRERAIPTVIGQTYPDWELLIVGDCCTDCTGTTIKSFHDKRIKFFNLPEKIYHYPKDDAKIEWLCGPCFALNKALDMVTGDYIARLDDDDFWLDKHLERSLSFISIGYDFVSSNAAVIVDGVVKVLPPYQNPTCGSVQTWLYSAKYKGLKYDPDCWKKEKDRNNEIDWYMRLYEMGTLFNHLDEIHAVILPRPGLTTIGSKAYIKERTNV